MNLVHLTEEQTAALTSFASRHGRRWKSKLLDLWMNGNDIQEPEGPYLRQIRNRMGPSRLHSFRLPNQFGKR